MSHPLPKLVGILMLSVFAAGSSPALAHGASDASANLSLGASLVTGSVVLGTLASVAGSGQLVVSAIEKVGDGVVYVLKNLSTGATVSVQVSAKVAGNVSTVVGTAIMVIADASGHAVMASGKMIAYIPNEIGKSLLHSRKSLERGQS